MPARLTVAVLVVLLAAATVFLLWSEFTEPPPVAVEEAEKSPVAVEQAEKSAIAAEEAEPQVDDPPQVAEITLRGWDRERLIWNRVKRDCPWPPLGDSWLALDAECVAAMNHLTAHWWRTLPAVPRPRVHVSEALADPVADHAAVAGALDDPRCMVPEGEARPDLAETCAAAAMVRLAALHEFCGMVAARPEMDFRTAYHLQTRYLDSRLDEAASEALSQEDYYRRAEYAYENSAGLIYRLHVCRSLPPAVLRPLAGLPGSLTESWANRGWALYELARRLGTERLLHYYPRPGSLRGDRGEAEAAEAASSNESGEQ